MPNVGGEHKPPANAGIGEGSTPLDPCHITNYPYDERFPTNKGPASEGYSHG